MKPLTEVNLLNDIVRFIGLYKNEFSKSTINSLKHLKVDIRHDYDNNYTILATFDRVKMLDMGDLTILKMTLIKYYPELNVKIFRESYDYTFGTMCIRKKMAEFDIFSEPINPLEYDSMFVIMNLATSNADEDIIKYVVPRANSESMDRWISICGHCQLLEAKALILRHMNHVDEDLEL